MAPTRLPSRPDDFPGDLWPRAVVILFNAIQKFPDQKQLRELCEHVVSKMTPLYCEAIETGKMEPGTVLNDDSGMGELLRLLLVANDPGHSSWGISDQAWRILQEVKTSTWGKVGEAIAEVQGDGTDMSRLGAIANLRQSRRAQNNGKATRGEERKLIESMATSWIEIEIAFLSDKQVEIRIGNSRKPYNYGELGFEDRRNGVPNRAWITLHEMSKHDGIFPVPVTTVGKELVMIQKRMEEIRSKLRSLFEIQADPIPFNSNTYQTAFKLRCRPSSDE